jgi:GT2 family glycosyltransferase
LASDHFRECDDLEADWVMKARDPLAPEPGEVAVIIPAFNSGAHLDQALASVAGQTLAPSAVVVADDCSEDDTVDRARGWQGRLPVEVVRLDRNQGPGVARRRAIQVSRAPLLAMLDADDLFLPDHLATMAATHAASPGLVSAQELSWLPGAGLTVRPAPRRPARKSDELIALLRHNFINFGFFSRDLYELAGGFGDQYIGEDWDLWIRMVRAGASVTMASHPTAIHRVHSSSLTFDAAQTAQHSVALLNTALGAARSPSEAAAARAGLQALRGKLSFYRAMELVDQGNTRQARQVAWGGLPGGGLRATAGLLTLALAPSTAARLERLTRPYRLPAGAYQPPSAHPPGDEGSATGVNPSA